MSRFAENHLESADGVAALALWRSFMAFLQDHRVMTIEEITKIQNAAIDDLDEMHGEIYAEARQVILHAFP